MAGPSAAIEKVLVASTLRQQFLLGMSHAACTVNVVTTDGVAGRHGVTVSAMVSVSADTPHPTLLVCIHHMSPVADALLRNGVFCVNVLREDQRHISDAFAGRGGVHGTAKFDSTRWTTLITGAPRVADALVAFDCRVTGSDRIGSHFVVFGSVEEISVAGGGAPLIYANRAYGVPQRFQPRPAPEKATSAGALSTAAHFFTELAMHTRIRKFNTRDTYPEQKLDNDLCQVVVAKGHTVFVRGQVGQDLDTAVNVGIGDAAAQAEQAMANIKQLLVEAGAALEHICKVTIYLTDPRFREPVYRTVGRWLKGVYPVSTGIVVAGLARPEWLVEVDVIAVIPEAA
jgi:flavin reductase (DIM6/NTAB) family NADH-FMN oxidoreductase RutF